LSKTISKNFSPDIKGKNSTTVKIDEEPKLKLCLVSWKRRKRIIRFLIYKSIKSWSFRKKTDVQNRQIATARLNKREKWIMMLNSASAFIIAYLTIQIIGQMLTLFIAQNFEFQGSIRYWGVVYFITSNDWTPDAVLTLYSVQPLVGLTLAFSALSFI
jgi:hypothetical protein